jgi:acetyl esterase/lipase
MLCVHGLQHLKTLFYFSSKPLISVSVDYSLAPERPFPLGVIDALSVVDFFITSNPSRKIHISGISAGANLALVSGLEAQRKYPGRVTR